MSLATPKSTSLDIEDIKIIALSDGHLDIPAAYFSNLSEQELLSVSPSTRLGANCWLIETGERKVLVDAGSGAWLKARFPATGQITETETPLMKATASVTDVVITHMHADHIGGLVGDGVSLFPNATLHLQETEWAFWTDDRLPDDVPEDKRPIVELIQSLARPISQQIKLYSGEADLGDGIHLVSAPGHTPGHQIVRVSSGDKQAYLLGDALVSGALQFTNPDVHYALDSAPEIAAQTRKSLFQKLAADQIPFAATHLDSTSFGMLKAKPDGGYAFETIA